MALADAPNEMNTSEKPRMKASEEMITRLRTGAASATVPVPRISSSESPEIYERYPGINGSTHGEMNDRSPAPNAARRVTFSITLLAARSAVRQTDRCERNRAVRHRSLHLHVMTFDGRQVLIHEVPLPPLRRIRSLQPAAGGQ